MLARLSVLDFHHPAKVPELVLYVERLGYSRFWTTEHHSAGQSASPLLVAAIAGAVTNRIRIGTAAILLNLYSPMKVAEDIRVLQTFFGSRVDMGVGSALPDEPYISALLDGREHPKRESYEAKVTELDRLIRSGSNNGGAAGYPIPGPVLRKLPEPWICGTSLESAKLAGGLGWSFAFSDHIYRHLGATEDPRRITHTYLDNFTKSEYSSQPCIAVTTYGLCTTSDKLADELWRDKNMIPGFLGSVERSADQIRLMSKFYDADEICIQSITDQWPARRLSYGLLARALLPAASAQEICVEKGT